MNWENAKQVLKALLPHQYFQKVLVLRDRLSFEMFPSLSFDTSNLSILPSEILVQIFANDVISSYWQKDHDLIRGFYGDDDKFGGVNPGDRRALYYLMMALKPKSILEVGTHIGASTLYIARALRRLGEGRTVTSVDILDVNDPYKGPWRHAGLPFSPKRLAEQLQCADHVVFHAVNSLEFMRTTEQRYDLIFLDGDHRPRAVYQEVSAALPLLSAGGVLLLHDYYPAAKPLFPDRGIVDGPVRALNRIQKESSVIKVLPLGSLPWPTKQGTTNTTLAIVTR
jgi:predicted O-methyltransferase YrrM